MKSFRHFSFSITSIGPRRRRRPRALGRRERLAEVIQFAGVGADALLAIDAEHAHLVFDIHGDGLPTMVITKPDDLHIAVTFRNTTASGVPVNGIQSYQVASIEPAIQQGADGVITVSDASPDVVAVHRQRLRRRCVGSVIRRVGRSSARAFRKSRGCRR